MPGKTSAGLLMYRDRGNGIEVLLVHPGGPFFRNKDDGAWSIPKGEVNPGEDFLERAKLEFQEELGFIPLGELLALGSVKQKGGKTVHAWALPGDLAENFAVDSNMFEIEWPPRSGKRQSFPEIDRASFFPVDIARRKINPAQIALLDRLMELLKDRSVDC